MYTLFAKAFFVSYLCTVKRDEALLIGVRRVSYLIYYIGVLINSKKDKFAGKLVNLRVVLKILFLEFCYSEM